MSDLFHVQADMSFVGRCFEVMCRGAPQHTYQVLTKRPRRMAEFAAHFEKYAGCQIPVHIWMGTSVENADVAGRIDELRRVRCAVRFVSFEPLLGGLPDVDLTGIHWAIIGGESGAGYRPMRADWVRGLIAACRRQQVAVFFKQWGGPRPKSGGREIDSRTYDEYPEVRQA